MNNPKEVILIADSTIPQYSELPKQAPSTPIEAVWFFTAAFIPTLALVLREACLSHKNKLQKQDELRAKKEALDIEQDEATLKYLFSLNARLVDDLCASRHDLNCANCKLKISEPVKNELP